MENITKMLGEHVAGLRYEELTEEVIQAAKQHILDGLGNQIAASAISEQARIVAHMMNRWGGKPESTIVGYGFKMPAPNATSGR